MTETDAADGIGAEPVDDLQALQRNALDLKRKADAATHSYDRTAWIRYAAMWVPIPFVVLLFRRHMEAWHYYIAGALFIVVGAVIYAMELAAVAKRDKAIQMAEHAQEIHEKAARKIGATEL
ncbi:MAG TPA: hypothetical protein VNG69_01825 [Casimicrobiaceae bacterium]|nr:hypothetical protein [Casimicrobiaceae bacterium]